MEPYILSAAELAVLAKTVGAMVCGAAIGIERERAEKPAGIRTHALVGGSACLLILLGMLLVGEYLTRFPAEALRADPSGVIEAVITGIAFLGAGTIIRGHAHVEGLTTAASILFTAAIGIAIASDHYRLAALLTAIVVVTLHLPYLWSRGRNKS